MARDVRQGSVSVEAAAGLSRVVVDPLTLDVDPAATERLRSGDEPTEEARTEP